MMFVDSSAWIAMELPADRRHVRLLWTSAPEFRSASSLMRERRDKRWSLVDCVSFVHMTALGIAKALTFDDNFAQAGYEVFPGKGRRRERPEKG